MFPLPDPCYWTARPGYWTLPPDTPSSPYCLPRRESLPCGQRADDNPGTQGFARCCTASLSGAGRWSTVSHSPQPGQQGARLTIQLPFWISPTATLSLLRRSAILPLHKRRLALPGTHRLRQPRAKLRTNLPRPNIAAFSDQASSPARATPLFSPSQSSSRKVCCRQCPHTFVHYNSFHTRSPNRTL